MRFLSLLGATLTLLSSSKAFPNITDPILPWQITHVSTFSPSSYPASHPHSRIFFTISDPNTITVGPPHPFGAIEFPPSTANCSVYWQSHSEDPRGPEWPFNTCAEMRISTGKWTFEIREGTWNIGVTGSAVTRNFVAVIRLSEVVVLGTGGIWRHKYEGEAAFAVGQNMEGACGGSGVCGYSLKDGPFLVNQRLVEAKCIIGNCDI
ncbi:hypothetical protein QBC38DRAFT_363470 [Podospora fimiseda]|uniref:Ubiquitin 3 binding protein But2 C-terminal domain-containing protein n=1 Tax=Podospora fimiseda TaxID=252190 RepID=A0AAN7H547_9PEZI|nr:hypothetical protein QBC38DRAFT_363470 [Podospora fimiseda]